MTNPPTAGTRAPDVTLPDTNGTPVRLADLQGEPVLVVFVPFAFSGICTDELCAIRDSIEDFEALNVRVLVISCDSVFTLKAWQAAEGFSFDLLSDFWPHGAASREFGVFDDERGLAVRGSFLIDADGVVRWSVVNQPGEARNLDDYREAIAAL